MKHALLFISCFLLKFSFSQEVFRISLEDSCIISDVTLNKTDFKHMARLCPKGLDKVKSYVLSFNIGSEHKEIYVSQNSIDHELLKNLRPGSKIYFEDIKGLSPEGR